MDFKDKLKALRQRRGISQEQLAKTIYVSRSAVAKWESGLGIPNDSNLEELCAYFQVEEDWLLDRSDLKTQIKSIKRQLPVIIAATVGIVIPVVCVMLGLCIVMFRQSIFISYYYPPLSLFEYIFTQSESLALSVLFWCSAAIWASTEIFSVLSVAIGKLRRNPRVCFWIELGLIILSAVLFLSLVMLAAFSENNPVYSFRP